MPGYKLIVKNAKVTLKTGGIAGGFVVEIKDQDGNVIQTFNTSGEYVITVLSGIKDTITSNVTTITDDII